jgi:ubiquinol-cytochrome c reductase cytochrome c subunit
MNAFAVIAALVLATVAAAAQSPQATPAARQGEVEKGRKLYVSYGCYQCHGYEAQGSTATGPRLGPTPIPLAAFTRYVRQPGGQMPPYTAKVLSETELAAIYAFVEARPAPQPVESIPLLKSSSPDPSTDTCVCTPPLTARCCGISTPLARTRPSTAFRHRAAR